MKDKIKMKQNQFTIDKGEIMRRRMNQNQNLNECGGITQKSKIRTIQALLLAFILAAFTFWMGPAVAAEKKMVKDPSTGKMVTAPEYGGRLTQALAWDIGDPPDAYKGGPGSLKVTSGVLEKLSIVDWAIDRDIFSFRNSYMPLTLYRPHLVESWDTPDPLTIIFNIRKGVNWQD